MHVLFLLHVCLYTTSKRAHEGQRRCQILYTDLKTACKQAYACWESNRSLLQELLATEPTLQIKKEKLSNEKDSQFQSETWEFLWSLVSTRNSVKFRNPCVLLHWSSHSQDKAWNSTSEPMVLKHFSVLLCFFLTGWCISTLAGHPSGSILLMAFVEGLGNWVNLAADKQVPRVSSLF